jgi:uncharacterized repeat protein (TIGR03987 family)
MDRRLFVAIAAITLALIFYSIGVWAERRSNTLKPWHVLAFWAGLVFDTTGTLTMTAIANSGATVVNRLAATIHGITGGLAIALMIIHALWATIVLLKKDQKRKQTFHRFSIVVWSIWLVPYLAGMIMGMF